jgi:TonB-linked SusC/RagA family outer membrane protein
MINSPKSSCLKFKYIRCTGLLISVFVVIASNAYSQNILDKRITIEVHQLNIKRVLKKIEKLANVRIAYSAENIDTSLVSINVTNQPISIILQQVLSTQNMSFDMVGGIIVLNKVYTNSGRISGAVTDETGSFLPGITVKSKDGTQATSTDANGLFSLSLSNKNTALIFSSINFNPQEVVVNGRSTIKVTMIANYNVLNEVVVIGYGTQKKTQLTGSVSSVSLDEIQETPSASLQNALTGKLTGFFSQQRSGRPGADGADFFIRGVSTFNGTGTSQQPLVLVDDIEFNYADFANIDVNEVQNISILKDAATTAPYGVKGANGVVLVTTRRGQIGKPRINLRSEYGLQVPMHIPQFLDAANTAILRNEAIKNDDIISGAAYVPQFTDADIELFRNGKDPYGHPNINWYNTLFKRTAPIQKNNFDVSGGTEKIKYFISLGYENQGGILRDIRSNNDINNNYYFDRINLRSNLDIKATNLLSFKVDFSGYNAITNSPKFPGASGSGETAAFYEVYNYESLNPYSYPIYNPNGSYGFASPNSTQPTANNIIGRIALSGYQRVLTNLLTLNVSATQKLDFITSGLQAKILANVTNGESSTQSLIRTNFPSYYYDPVTNTYTPRDATISRIDPYTSNYIAGSPTRQSTVQASLNYAKIIHENNISGLLLYNQNTKIGSVFEDGTELASSNIPETLQGFTARINYSHANKYLAEFDGSYNGSSKFAVNKRYGFFPAGSAGYVLSEEDIIKKNAPFIDLFKARVSYGIVGSDNLGNYANYYQETYNRGSGYPFGESTQNNSGSIIPGAIGNANVTWEKERKFDAGIDFSMLKGKIVGSADVFRDKRYDILTMQQTVPDYYGVDVTQLPPENLGVVANNGYEFELTYNGKMGKLGYSFKGSYSYAKNKILQMDEVQPLYPWQKQTGRSIGEVPEFIWDGFYSAAEAANPSVPKYAGSTTASGGPSTTVPGFLKYRDLNNDGIISDADKGYFGNSNLPTTVVALTSVFKYDRFSLNILMQAALNYDVQIGYALVTPFKGNLQNIDLQRWTPATAATAQFPSLITNFQGSYMSSGNTSTFWAISGNYLRIKSMELSYRIPEKWINKIGLKSMQVYANAYNLHTWSAVYNRFGLDPEVARGGATNDYQGVYPQSAIINIGFSTSLK